METALLSSSGIEVCGDSVRLRCSSSGQAEVSSCDYYKRDGIGSARPGKSRELGMSFMSNRMQSGFFCNAIWQLLARPEQSKTARQRSRSRLALAGGPA